MIIVAAQRNRTQDAQHLTAPILIPALDLLELDLGHRDLGQQSFQQTPTILQEGYTQSRFDPLGGQRLTLLQTLLEELQEGFGVPVTFGLDFLEFFLRFASVCCRVIATVRSTNSSASC